MTNEEIIAKAKAFAQQYEATPMAEAAARGYAAGVTEALQLQWKEVDAENPSTLPKENQVALCRLDDGDFIVAKFERVSVYDIDGEECHVPEWWVDNGCESYILSSEITHWMPIPNPPMKGGER